MGTGLQKEEQCEDTAQELLKVRKEASGEAPTETSPLSSVLQDWKS